MSASLPDLELAAHTSFLRIRKADKMQNTQHVLNWSSTLNLRFESLQMSLNSDRAVHRFCLWTMVMNLICRECIDEADQVEKNSKCERKGRKWILATIWL
jgi:hypothetical protein